MHFRLKLALLASVTAGALASPAMAADTKISLGISGWTGFAPLTLAAQAGLFKKRGLDVDIKMIPQKDRLLALASNSVQCAATTVETYISWSASGVPVTQIVQLDKSYGADGLAVRGTIKSFADLKGKTVSVDAPGTTSYFTLAYMLRKNGMSFKDIKTVTLSPDAAAQSFVAGQGDAAMTYEPYLSTVRDNPGKGRILATTLQYPVVMDTLGCTATWLKANPKAAQALVDGYFDALAMIKREPEKSNQIMGASVKQSGKEFAESATFLRWANKADNKAFFAKDLPAFTKDAAVLLTEAGIIHKTPDLSKLYDARFLK